MLRPPTPACSRTTRVRAYVWAAAAVWVVVALAAAFPSMADAAWTYQSEIGARGQNGQLESAMGMALDGSGNMYVADTVNHRIQKFDSSGAYVSQFGSLGAGNGQLHGPTDVAIDGSGNIWVVDSGNDRVQKFNSSGVYQSKFGTSGTGNGQFSTPFAIAIDGSGNMWVTDVDLHRVQRFNSSSTYVSQFGSYGTGNGQFHGAFGISIKTSDGSIYVADAGNDRVQKFSSAGAYQSEFGSYGYGNGQMHNPYDVKVDSSGNVFVADFSNGRVQKFNSSHTFQVAYGWWGFADAASLGTSSVEVDASGNVYSLSSMLDKVLKFNAAGVYLARFTSNTGAGELSMTAQVTRAPDGSLYVVDPSNNRVIHYSATGSLLHTFGSVGSGNGQFQSPYGIAVGQDGTVYVGDVDNRRIQAFTAAGAYITQFGTAGSGNGEISEPRGLGVGPDGNVYVTECGNDRVQVFSPSGAYLSKFGQYGTARGEFRCPMAVDFGPDGSIFVLDENNHRVQKFTARGAFVLQFGSNGSNPGQFGDPWGFSVGTNGDVYVTDWWVDRITRFTASGTLKEVFGVTASEHETTGFDSNTYVLALGNSTVLVAEGGANRLSYWADGPQSTMPNAPAALAQFRSNGVTSIPSASWTDQSSAVMNFTVSDNEASQTLTPWVEIRPIGVPLTATCGAAVIGATFSGSNVAATVAGTSYAASVTVTGLLAGEQYHWRACAIDQSGNAGRWTNMGFTNGTRDLGVRPAGTLQATGINDGTGADIDTQSSQTVLDANWTAAADVNGSDAATYNWCFTTNTTNSCGASGRVAQSLGQTALTAHSTGLSLNAGTTYYFCIQAVDISAMTGAYTCSDGNLVAPLAGTVSGFALRGESDSTKWQECDGFTANVRLSVNGGAPVSTSCNATTGAYTFTGVVMPGAGQPLIVYLGSSTNRGATYYVVDTGGGVGGLNVVQDRVTLRAQTSATVTPALFQVYDGTDTAGAIPVDATTSITAMTFGSGTELHIDQGVDFDPVAAAMTVGSIHVADGGTLHGVSGWFYHTITGYGTSATCSDGPHEAAVLCVDPGGAVNNSGTAILLDLQSTVNRPAALQALPNQQYDGVKVGSSSTLVLGTSAALPFEIYTEFVSQGTVISDPWNLDVTVPYLYVNDSGVWRGNGAFTITTEGTLTGTGLVELPNVTYTGTGNRSMQQIGPEANGGEWTIGDVNLKSQRTNHQFGMGSTGGRSYNSGGTNVDTPAAMVAHGDYAYHVITSPGSSTDWVITRQEIWDGDLDTGWDGDGALTITSAGADVARGAAISSDGKLLVSGSMNGNWQVRKFNTDGSPDTSFDGDGIWSPGISGAAKALVVSQTDGSIFVGGEDASNVWQIRHIGANGGATLHSASWNGDTGSGATVASVKAMCTTPTSWGAANDVYIVGTVGGASTDWAIGNYHFNGATWGWQPFLDGASRPGKVTSAGTADSANTCAVTTDGSSVFVGGVNGSANATDDGVIRYYDGAPGGYGNPVTWWARASGQNLKARRAALGRPFGMRWQERAVLLWRARPRH